MSVAELQEADKRLRMATEIGMRSPSQLEEFARQFLNADPIDEQWLREKWGDAVAWDDDEARFVLLKPPVMLTVEFIHDGGHPHVFKNDQLLAECKSKGQFTALMFGLGITPKN